MSEFKKSYWFITPFSRIIIFIVLGLIGSFLISQLSISLKPKQDIPVISIKYSWGNINPRIIESEVTSKIEQSLSSLTDLIKISSLSSKGQGTIRLEFSENINIDKTTLYVRSIIRNLYSFLPKGVSFPRVIKHGINNEDSEVLLSLSISGNRSKDSIYAFIENNFKPKISKIKGISSVETFGIPEYDYVIYCDNFKLNRFKVDITDVKSTILSFLEGYDIGLIRIGGHNTHLEVTFKEKKNEIYDVLNLSVLNKSDEVIRLSDLIEIDIKERRIEGYKRFNGFNAITMNIATSRHENQIELSKKIKKNVQLINNYSSKNGIKINILYDSTVLLKKELEKISYRILFSLGSLILFVLVINRNFKYVFIILISLVLNLLTAVIFYHILSVDIHLYSLAGLTISLGIMIDNVIIMLDHLFNQKNDKVVTPILASTITSIAALSIIFFIKKEYQLFLFDFSWIIIINLAVSLMVTFFLVPSLYKNNNHHKKYRSYGQRKKVVLLSNIYKNVLLRLIKGKKVVFILFILLFGIPLFLIPKTISGNSDISKLLNPILKSEFYKENIADNLKYLGGTLYAFLKSTEKGSFISSPKRTSIKVRLFNPEGGTIEQLDYAIKSFENVISGLTEIESFLTEVYSPNTGFIEIFIKKKYEKSEVPEILKNKLESIALEIGGIDCSIIGVGNAFSNSANLNSDATIKIKGYNLDNLLDMALEIKKDYLLKHNRISNVKINSEKSWILKDKYNFKLNLLQDGLFSFPKISNKELIDIISWNSGNESFISNLNGKRVVIAENNEFLSSYEFAKTIISNDSLVFGLGQIATIEKENVINIVVKMDGDYEIYLDYSFAGTFELNKIVQNELLTAINNQLPMGYTAQNPDKNYNDLKEDFLIIKISLIIILIIYFICSILFESLVLPLAIILTIPCSFIGIFSTFSLFDIPFDQGGLASFIMLSGITVNSSIYILNQYQNLKKTKEPKLSTYIKAFNMMIIPILLTIISSILGLLPFVLIEGTDFFWTSFAYGNIGGLLFSIFVIVFFTPLCIKFKKYRL